jgi:2-polyprenyl-6-methoxyphenol hydroxylase-like FAD-dependent oxidoreductase
MRLPPGLNLGVQDAVNLGWKLDHDMGQHAAADRR